MLVGLSLQSATKEVSDRFSAYNHRPVDQRQLCWANLRGDLIASAERQGKAFLADGFLSLSAAGALNHCPLNEARLDVHSRGARP